MSHKQELAPRRSQATITLWDLIDRTTTLERLGHDEELFSQLLDFFLEDYAATLEKLRAALQQQDAQMVEYAAHSLKGLAANIGAANMAQQCGELEACGHRHELARGVVLLAELQVELERLIPAIVRYRTPNVSL